MSRGWWGRGLILLAAMLALGGCGGGDSTTGGSSAEESGQAAPKPGSNVPERGRTVTARVYEKAQKRIPADIGQWMVTIGVAPGDRLAFTVRKVVVPPGNANFRLVNPRAAGHNLQIERVGAAKGKRWVHYPAFKGEPSSYLEEFGSGEIEGGTVKTTVVRKGTAWLRKPLSEGKRYVFYCSVPGHREAGMEGTIVVDPRLDADDLKPF